MKLYLISASTNVNVNRPLLERIAEALEHQLFAHVAPFWQSAGISVGVLDAIADLPDADSSPLVVYDDPDQADVLGWHTYQPESGLIHGTAFLNPILANGGSLLSGPNSLSATLSHEAIEAASDPYVNLYAFKDEHTIEPIEPGDRVQGDSYDINGVSVSNFLGPRAFRDGPGPYDWMLRLENPWDLSPGGYCQRLNVRTGKTTTLFGAAVPEWRRELTRLKRARSLSRLSHRSMMQSEAAQGE